MKSYLTKIKRLRPKHLRRLPPQYLFIAVFMFVGIGTLLYTRAASPTAHFEAENAALTCASAGSDANASGGQYIQFNGTDCTGQVQMASSVSQYGITWNFSQPKQVGQFANGDWWVVGPVTITSMSPAYDTTNKLNGWQVNPTQTESHGFDGNAFDFNAALIPALPYNASAGQSIVKAISVGAPRDNCMWDGSCVQTAAILTVLGSVPANNGSTVFRPPYFGTNKPLFSTNDMDANMGILPRLNSTAAIDQHLMSIASAWDDIKRVNLKHNHYWSGTSIMPRDSYRGMIKPYGAGVSNIISESFLRMLIVKPGESETERRRLAIGLVQYGIDIYGSRAGGVTWAADGGSNYGFRLPMAFAGLMLNNSTIKTTLANSPKNAFTETDQIVAKNLSKPGITIWGQPGGDEDDYWRELTNQNGSANNVDPYKFIDGGGDPGQTYQHCCTSMARKGSALITRLIPGLQAVWSDISSLEYADRWVDFGVWTQPDPCAPVSQGGGPHPTRAGECVLDPDLTTGSTFASFSCQAGKQCGRAPARHGQFANDGGWNSDLIDVAWPVYRNW